MANPDTIYVTSLFAMPQHVSELEPARLISIIQPELQPQRPPEIDPTDHLRVGVHDITEQHYESVLAGDSHLELLLDFIERWDPASGALLVHCYAGISRSTAVAMIAHHLKTGDPLRAATALRAAAPHAAPNRHIIALADRLLGCNGALIDARETMGDHVRAGEGPLTTLPLD